MAFSHGLSLPSGNGAHGWPLRGRHGISLPSGIGAHDRHDGYEMIVPIMAISHGLTLPSGSGAHGWPP